MPAPAIAAADIIMVRIFSSLPLGRTVDGPSFAAPFQLRKRGVQFIEPPSYVSMKRIGAIVTPDSGTNSGRIVK
jgi:hypothetical protein